MYEITLPWPPKDLSPNSRIHWAKLAQAKKAYRTECFLQARIAGVKRQEARRAHVSISFVPPDRRGRDLDNCLAMLKSGLDGIADALGIDDKNWTLTLAMAETVGGMVKVTVEVKE